MVIYRLLIYAQADNTLQYLQDNFFHWKKSLIKFYDKSWKKFVTQAIGNRLKVIFDDINTPIPLKQSNCGLWLLLKKVFFKQNNPSENLLGMCCNGPGPLPTLQRLRSTSWPKSEIEILHKAPWKLLMCATTCSAPLRF